MKGTYKMGVFGYFFKNEQPDGNRGINLSPANMLQGIDDEGQGETNYQRHKQGVVPGYTGKSGGNCNSDG